MPSGVSLQVPRSNVKIRRFPPRRWTVSGSWQYSPAFTDLSQIQNRRNDVSLRPAASPTRRDRFFPTGTKERKWPACHLSYCWRRAPVHRKEIPLKYKSSRKDTRPNCLWNMSSSHASYTSNVFYQRELCKPCILPVKEQAFLAILHRKNKINSITRSSTATAW